MEEKTKEKINDILKRKSFSQNVTEELKLADDLGFDSLNLVELIVNLEEEFNIEIDESDLDPQNLKTVKQIYTLIEKYTEK